MKLTAAPMLLVLTPLLGSRLDACTDPPADCPECVADFALFDPAYENDGVWEEEVTALETLFTTYGWTWQRLGPADLNALALGSGSTRRFRALVAPGGYAYARNRDVDAVGEAGIRDFLAQGGGYVGFCAGSFWAATEVVWAETASGGGGTYNQAADYLTYPYELQLLPGAAQGPYGWMPWLDGTNASLEPVALDTSIPTLQAAGLPSETRFFYYGGPFFPDLDPSLPGLEVWARAIPPAGLDPAASSGAGQPTLIKFDLGTGPVVLFSYHPDILIGSMVDGVELTSILVEANQSWDTGNQTLDEINLQSWNSVHAALQVAAGWTVTPLTQLPAP